ncbi:hypothetical protein MKW92_017493 [Papaver armeniacum]|nr:hypothetical protein MKW92_017493 [Papaver armeniacum]
MRQSPIHHHHQVIQVLLVSITQKVIFSISFLNTMKKWCFDDWMDELVRKWCFGSAEQSNAV